MFLKKYIGRCPQQKRMFKWTFIFVVQKIFYIVHAVYTLSGVLNIKKNDPNLIITFYVDSKVC